MYEWSDCSPALRRIGVRVEPGRAPRRGTPFLLSVSSKSTAQPPITRAVVGAAPELVAAVDAQHLPGDPRRLRTGEIAHGRRDVVDGADACDRHVLVVAVEDRSARRDERHQLGVDDARLHRVDADVVLAELVGRALHEHLDAGLARAVRAHEPVRRVTGDRRHADDRAAAAAHHRRRRVLDAEERADEVEVDGRPPAVDIGCDDRAAVQRATRAREQHVELAGRFDRGGDGALDVGLVGDVADDVAARSRPGAATAVDLGDAPRRAAPRCGPRS